MHEYSKLLVHDFTCTFIHKNIYSNLTNFIYSITILVNNLKTLMMNYFII